MSNNIFDKFNNKITKEALIKGIICGVSLSLIIEAIILVICKLTPLKIIVWLHVLLTIVLAIFFSYKFFKMFIPSEKDIAARIDKDASMNERVKTMVEFKNQDSPMINLQRKDTLDKLNNVSEKTLKMKFTFSNFILVLIAILALPSAIILKGKELPNQNNNEISESINNKSEIINSAIENMKSEVENNSQLDESTKDQINSELEDLENNLNQDSNQEEVEEDVENTKENLDEIFDEMISKDEIGEALEKEDSTQDLGNEVANGDSESVKDSLDQLRDSLENLTGDELKEALENIANDIKQALENSGVDSEDALYKAFENLANNLQNNANNVNDSDIQNQIDSSFEQAKQEISDALKDQEALEDLKESLKDKLEDLEQDLNNPEQGEYSEVSGDVSGEPSGTMSGTTSGELTSGEQSSEGSSSENGEETGGESGENPGGNTGGTGSGDMEYASDDIVYDPVTNTYVTYGELITKYYNDILQGIEDGQVSPEMEKLIADYFGSLYSDDEEGNN